MHALNCIKCESVCFTQYTVVSTKILHKRAVISDSRQLAVVKINIHPMTYITDNRYNVTASADVIVLK